MAFYSTQKNEKSFGKHPTQKPLQLLDLIIQASTDINDDVLDPFDGSGTTGVSCIKNKRNYLGIEFEKKFCDLSKKRFQNELIMSNSRSKFNPLIFACDPSL